MNCMGRYTDGQPKIWFASDHHFDHDKILGFTERGKTFKTIEEMNEAIIKAHNRVVKHQDTVFFLGDFSWNWSPSRIKELLNQLNGKKILVVGNHDKVNTLNGMNLGFDLVVNRLDMKIAGVDVVLSHYPSTFGILKRILRDILGLWVVPDWHKRPTRKRDTFYIHGHTHSPVAVKGKCIHVGLDANDMRPTPYREIENYINRYYSPKKS